MKIYSKLVIDLFSGQVLEEVSSEYEGEVALAKGSEASPGKPAYSVAGQIIAGMKPQISGAIKDSIVNNPFFDAGSREYQAQMQGIRGSYGARGLAGSGIAVQGEQQALSDIQLKSQAQRAGQLTGLLGTASSSPSFPASTQSGGKGFMGLK